MNVEIGGKRMFNITHMHMLQGILILPEPSELSVFFQNDKIWSGTERNFVGGRLVE